MVRQGRYNPKGLFDIEVTLLMRDLDLIMQERKERLQEIQDLENTRASMLKEYAATGKIAAFDEAIAEGACE